MGNVFGSSCSDTRAMGRFLMFLVQYLAYNFLIGWAHSYIKSSRTITFVVITVGENLGPAPVLALGVSAKKKRSVRISVEKRITILGPLLRFIPL